MREKKKKKKRNKKTNEEFITPLDVEPYEFYCINCKEKSIGYDIFCPNCNKRMKLYENSDVVSGIPPASKAAENFADLVIKKRCVICHKKLCPSCKSYMLGSKSCHEECPYCEKNYHKHCWNKLIRSFGKCAFCLETPPSELIPKDQ